MHALLSVECLYCGSQARFVGALHCMQLLAALKEHESGHCLDAKPAQPQRVSQHSSLIPRNETLCARFKLAARDAANVRQPEWLNLPKAVTTTTTGISMHACMLKQSFPPA